MIKTGNRVTIRSIKKEDLPGLYHYIYGVENPEWKKWDAPYFPLGKLSYRDFCDQYEMYIQPINQIPSRTAIEVKGKVIGIVSFYWEHQPSYWLESGIAIYDPSYWSEGYGTEALTLWISYLFDNLPLVRVGLTTWSGNARMMKCAEKLGFTLEGRLRKCRLYQGKHYDSMRYGVLREEWERLGTKSFNKILN
ncbi:GNAT family N-acetyltransferase [Metabacillus arenae]|uniref:GNAT family N-acetyltransferase n=1 Tax=Metabacillus arenae TaxID=2771434 RepID=A0A926NG17_9BACI|nr:GNAT family protein [Metabacillus arenae]MBD1380606.1 GNAT family N-acetyltransferase [Metabacillus arenae]